MRAPLALLALLALLVPAAGCARPLSTDAQVPEYAPKDQASAQAAKSPSRPLILEWPAADRAALEGQLAGGGVVVRYGNREMEVLRGCRVAARYRYTAITPKQEDLVMRDSSELDAQMPIHPASLEARLQQKQQLEVAMTIVGLYQADPKTWRAADLQGDCAGATHVIDALTVGAFEIAASAAASQSARVRVLGAGAGGEHTSEREVLHGDGKKEACDRSAARDASPPYACGALLRV
ncbi:MAG: hypothetical protein ACRELB_19685, partial [Polyangiaceae bacterium]